jgi:hypothetical protein
MLSISNLMVCANEQDDWKSVPLRAQQKEASQCQNQKTRLREIKQQEPMYIEPRRNRVKVEEKLWPSNPDAYEQQRIQPIFKQPVIRQASLFGRFKGWIQGKWHNFYNRHTCAPVAQVNYPKRDKFIQGLANRVKKSEGDLQNAERYSQSPAGRDVLDYLATEFPDSDVQSYYQSPKGQQMLKGLKTKYPTK